MYNFLHFIENFFLTTVLIFLISISVFPYFITRPNFDNFLSKTTESKVFGSYSFEISGILFTRDENGDVVFEGYINGFEQKKLEVPPLLLSKEIFLKNQNLNVKYFFENGNLIILNNSETPIFVEGLLH